MGKAKKIAIWLSSVLATILLVALLALVLTGISPIYDFNPPGRFSEPAVFNPYAALDTCRRTGAALPENFWKRANFHTHTEVEGPFNECDHSPQATYDSLASFGCDIVTFSNHNKLTRHPFDTSLQVNVYEHGYNIYKYHKLVFGARAVNHFDALLPLLTSQKQFQLDLLRRGSDFIQMNHPFRTGGTSKRQMECLEGYQITELDSGVTTENEYWDWSLSAGHYSFALANDDLHHPDRSDCIAVRCNFLNTPSGRYEDLRKCLLGGCYYSMRIPDAGCGDWSVKHGFNRRLPYITDIGLCDGDSVYVNFSRPAARIIFNGQDHCVLSRTDSAYCAGYRILPSDSYARITAYFDDGCVIYSNPFARFNPSATPVKTHTVNLWLTVLYNLSLLVSAAFSVWLIVRLRRLRQFGVGHLADEGRGK